MAKIKLKQPKSDNAALRAVKQGAKAKAKSVFKSEVAVAKANEAGMPKYMVRDNIKDERKNYRETKKEIRKYTDY
jgi:cellulose biosynthesis protein BcsQ